MTRLLVVADRSPPRRLADAVMGRHSSARYAGDMPCRHWYTVAVTRVIKVFLKKLIDSPTDAARRSARRTDVHQQTMLIKLLTNRLLYTYSEYHHKIGYIMLKESLFMYMKNDLSSKLSSVLNY